MGKTARIKGDLDDVAALLEIIQILKDVSTNRFFAFAQQKEDFSKFLEVFLVFFEMLGAVDTTCPLVRNNNPGIDIIIITSESSFMSQMNGKVCNVAAQEFKKNPEAKVICVGWRAAEKCKQLGVTIDKLYRDVDAVGRYEVALMIRDYLIERMMSGASGKAICVYTWTKSFNVLKPRIIKLLPASELIGGEEDTGDGAESAESAQTVQHRDVILESSVDGIMKVLADIWISSRLYEILQDQKLAEAASQSQQLEQAIEGLSKEKSGLALSLKKSQRADLNKAMREVFTSSKVIKVKRGG